MYAIRSYYVYLCILSNLVTRVKGIPSIPQYPNTQGNPNGETPNIGTSGHSADRCHGSPHALNQTSLLSSIDLAEDQVEFLYRLPKQRRSLFQVAGFSCSRLVVATLFQRHCPSSTTTFGLGYFVIPWVFGCFVICHLWRSFIPCCLSQTRLTKRHSRLDVYNMGQYVATLFR